MVIYHSDGMIFFDDWSSYTPAVVWVGGFGGLAKAITYLLHDRYVLTGEQGLLICSRKRTRFAITYDGIFTS